MAHKLSQKEVLAGRDSLPAFPRVIEDVLTSLDDPEANLTMLVEYAGRDPVLTARIFSYAEAMRSATRNETKIRDLFTATSLIGLSRLRQIAIMTSLAGFLRGELPRGLSPGFWEHSAATGICAQQLALHVRQPADPAMVAGLLHDIGQLWLYRYDAESFVLAWQIAAERKKTIEQAERDLFGVDHAAIGAWLAESWSLPRNIVEAIQFHHKPDGGPQHMLVPLTHVAEVLSNALDLSGGEGARVSYLSARSCAALGLTWDASANSLFGRIDAVSQFVNTYFRQEAA